MPARPAAAPRTFPTDVAILFIPRLPQSEIANVFLVVLVVLHPAGRLQLGKIEMRQLAVVRKFVDPKINRLVVRLISETARDECIDHLDHSVDVMPIGRSGKFISGLDPQRFDIFKKCLFELGSEFCERNFRFTGSADSFVVHVGDVHDAMHLVASQLEMSLEQILEDISSKISNVRAAVDGWSACVDADLAFRWIARLKFFDLARIGIKKAQCH